MQQEPTPHNPHYCRSVWVLAAFLTPCHTALSFTDSTPLFSFFLFLEPIILILRRSLHLQWRPLNLEGSCPSLSLG